MPNLPYIENLAIAIVHDSVNQYRKICKRCKTLERLLEDDSVERIELEKFFMSRWCDLLTMDSGQEIMDTIRREELGGHQRRKRRK